MGGRGSKLDVNTYLNKSHSERTSEYASIWKKGNIEFVKQNIHGSVSAPIFSNSPNMTYVVLSGDRIQSVTKYDNNHKQAWSIHPGHGHNPHTHEHGPIGNRGSNRNISSEKMQIYNKAVKIFNNEIKGK